MPDRVKPHVAELVWKALDERGDLFWGQVPEDCTVEVRRIDGLNTQIRVKPRAGGAPRYFNVKVSEVI